MDDQIKKIAALIGHQQQQETRVTALIEAFEKESTLLREENAKLAGAIRSLSQATGDVTDTVRQSVSRGISQVSEEVKSVALEKQKPVISVLTQVVNEARESVKSIRREAAWFYWKSAFWTVLLGFTLLTGILIGFTYYLNHGYQRIADMQAMEKQWEKKAPLANISTCDDKPCVEVTGTEYSNKNGDRFYLIRQDFK
ncbi:tRNA modification GTPase [Rosenbergiella epipactidis]|uniref:tRNA modification GTPase n=1 Tax=Rosenbergiella epipactidis TaxID=1544694 RepID=UPI001BD91FF2|nr:tRNA modification GTPase [Rosenbergiella epipactidis]MBT0718597.1 tRNA modification GTPase [Rosenbergiella epipactidis]